MNYSLYSSICWNTLKANTGRSVEVVHEESGDILHRRDMLWERHALSDRPEAAVGVCWEVVFDYVPDERTSRHTPPENAAIPAESNRNWSYSETGGRTQLKTSTAERIKRQSLVYLTLQYADFQSKPFQNYFKVFQILNPNGITKSWKFSKMKIIFKSSGTFKFL